MKKLTVLSILALASQLMISCTSYHDDLQEKLAGLSPEQRRVVLAQECKEKISEEPQPHNPAMADHIQRMKYICEEMTAQKISLAK